MGHITEPEGVDFIIESKELTNDERKEISAFIIKRKKQLLENSKNKAQAKKPTPQQDHI